jgi:hypothetical protein
VNSVPERSPVNEVGEVEIVDVVSGDDVRVCFPDKVCPTLEQRRLRVVRDDVGTDDGSTRVQRKHVANERLRLALFVFKCTSRWGTVFTTLHFLHVLHNTSLKDKTFWLFGQSVNYEENKVLWIGHFGQLTVSSHLSKGGIHKTSCGDLRIVHGYLKMTSLLNRRGNPTKILILRGLQDVF